MTVVKYRAIGQDGKDGWYAMVSLQDGRAIGTLCEPGIQRRGRIHKQFNVKVSDTGLFKVGVGTSGFKIRFRHRLPANQLEAALQKRVKLNMDRASARAVAKLRAGIDALIAKHSR